MTRLILTLTFFCGCFAVAHSQQGRIYQNEKGQLVTTFDLYSQSQNSAPRKEITYLGYPHLTYPIWQKGVIQIEPSSKEITCDIAYDLFTNDVLCRFEDKLEADHIAPYRFQIDTLEFFRQPSTLLGAKSHLYTTLLHDGPTKLLRSLTKSINTVIFPTNGYYKPNEFAGVYQTREILYIRKGEARPQIIELTKESVVTALHEQSAMIDAFIKSKQLTIQDVSRVLTYYDYLMTLASANKPALSFDPLFNQFLHDYVIYPNSAWLNYVYARVYVGFDVTKAGQITNITLLSPDNIGFGFDLTVTQALEKYLRLKPEFAGHYALPVAFTLTNRKEKNGSYVPINTLPSEKTGNRTLLEEFVVPIVLSKPVATVREVWGYFK